MASIIYTASTDFHLVDFHGDYVSKEDMIGFTPPLKRSLLENQFVESKPIPFNFNNEVFDTITGSVKYYDELGMRIEVDGSDNFYSYASITAIEPPKLGSIIKATVFSGKVLSFVEVPFFTGKPYKKSFRDLNFLYNSLPLNSSQRAVVSTTFFSVKGSLLLLTEGTDLYIPAFSEYTLPHKITRQSLLEHLIKTPAYQPIILCGLERYSPSLLCSFSELLGWGQLSNVSSGSRPIIASTTLAWYNSHFTDFEGKFMHTIIIDELSLPAYERNESLRLSRSLSVQVPSYKSIDLNKMLSSGYEEIDHSLIRYVKTELSLSFSVARSFCYGFSKLVEFNESSAKELVKILRGSLDEDHVKNNVIKSTPKIVPKSKKKRTELVVEYLQSICEEKETDMLSKSEVMEVMESMQFTSIQSEELLESLNIGGYLLKKGPMYKLNL